MSSPPQADPWHATQSRRSFFFHYPVRLHITSRVSLFFFVFVSFDTYPFSMNHRHTNDNEEEQDLTAAGEGNTKQALRASNLRDKCLEETRSRSENFKSDATKRGIGTARAVEPNQISKRIRYQKQTRILLFFRENLENFNPFWANARGIRVAKAIELNSESKIIRYQKQTKILPF